MEVMLGLMCILIVWIFVKNFKEMVVLNTNNIKVKQPISVYQAPDIEVFDYYVKTIKKTPEEAWNNIVSLGADVQTYEEFVTEKKIDYRLRGILIMLLMEIRNIKKEPLNVRRGYIED